MNDRMKGRADAAIRAMCIEIVEHFRTRGEAFDVNAMSTPDLLDATELIASQVVDVDDAPTLNAVKQMREAYAALIAQPFDSQKVIELIYDAARKLGVMGDLREVT